MVVWQWLPLLEFEMFSFLWRPKCSNGHCYQVEKSLSIQRNSHFLWNHVVIQFLRNDETRLHVNTMIFIWLSSGQRSFLKGWNIPFPSPHFFSNSSASSYAKSRTCIGTIFDGVEDGELLSFFPLTLVWLRFRLWLSKKR